MDFNAVSANFKLTESVMENMPFKKITDEKQLKLTANTIRQNIIKALVEAKSGHSGGPLGQGISIAVGATALRRR